jgi:sphinganine C4-monooxygenase
MSSIIMTSLLPPANSSLLRTLTPTGPHYPFYHPTGASILPFMTDKVTSLLVPIVAYWVFSLIWHAIDCAELPFFEKYRIHESEEVLARNRATVGEVIKAVVIQQVVQTALGMVWLESEEEILKREVWRDHTSDMKGLAGVLGSGLQVLLGEKTALAAARLLGGEKITGWVYWWGVPLLQMGFAL